MSSTTEPRNSAGSDLTHRRQVFSAWAERDPTKGCKNEEQKRALSDRIVATLECSHLRGAWWNYQIISRDCPSSPETQQQITWLPAVLADESSRFRRIDRVAPQRRGDRALSSASPRRGVRRIPVHVVHLPSESSAPVPIRPSGRPVGAGATRSRWRKSASHTPRRSRARRVRFGGANGMTRLLCTREPNEPRARRRSSRPGGAEHPARGPPPRPPPPTARSLRLVDLRRWP